MRVSLTTICPCFNFRSFSESLLGRGDPGECVRLLFGAGRANPESLRCDAALKSPVAGVVREKLLSAG